MPPVIIAIVAGLTAAFGAAAAVAIINVTIFMAVTLGIDVLLNRIFRPHAATITSQMTVRQPVSYRRIIYGSVRAAGVMTYCGLSGSKNEYLHLVLTLAGHQITSIGSMYFDGNLASPSSSSPYYYYDLETDLGDPANTSQPFPHLASAIPGWSSACLQRSCAKVHLTLKYDVNKYPNGAPSSIAFDVHGKKLYDPRTSTTVYSNNAALCIRDFLTDAKYGLGAVSASIDDAYTTAAANTCDESVAISSGNTATIGSCTHVTIISGQGAVTATNNLKIGAQVALSAFTYATFLNGLSVTVLARTATSFTFSIAYADYDHSDSGTAIAPATQARYTCDGVFDAGQLRGDVLRSLCSAMAGWIVPPGDAWRILAGIYRTPTIILKQDDLRGPIKMDTLVSKRELANGITGTFVSPANNWQQSNFPPVLNSTYVTQDGGNKIWQDMQLPFTTDGIRAQRLAKITLERIRRQITLTLPCKLSAFPLEPGDTVMFTFDPFGFNQKIFEVQQAAVVADASTTRPYNVSEDASPISNVGQVPILGVDLVLKETDSGVYSWNAATDENTWLSPSPTTLPDLKVCQPVTGLSASSGAGTAIIRADGLIHDRILVQWTAPSDQFVTNGGSVEVYLSPHGAGTWDLVGTVDGADTQFYILNVVDGTAYDVQVYAVNAAGVTSAVAEVDNVTASGGTTSFAGVIPTSTPLNNQGSISNVSTYTFTYASTTNSITWSWAAFTCYAADGSTVTVAADSQAAFTGLSGATTYYFGMYVTLNHDGTGTAHVVKSDVSSGTGPESVQQKVQVVNADGCVAVAVNVTAATGSSGGGGGGGGKDGCFSPNTRLKTRRGSVRFKELRVGDSLLTARNTWRPVTKITRRPYDGPALDMADGELVTLTHLFLNRELWLPVLSLDKYSEVHYTGEIWNAHLETEADDDGTRPDTEHSYTLANGAIVHNLQT